MGANCKTFKWQGQINEAIERNEDLWMDYIDKNPVNRGTQVAADMSKREVNTWYCPNTFHYKKCIFLFKNII